MNENDKLAGFWRRIFAYAIDFILVLVLFVLVYFGYLSLTGREMSLDVLYLFFVPYFAFATGVWAKTAGMKLLGLYVVCEGSRDEVGFIRALLRAIMMSLIAGPFVGCLLIPFRKNKQALHDWVCGTAVYVRGRAPEE